MAGSEVGVGYVRLLPSMQGFSAAASTGMSGALASPATAAGTAAGANMSAGLAVGMQGAGKTLTRTLTPAAAGVALGMRSIGNEWNTGVNAIISGTGAAGSQLDSLTGSMKKVGGQVPQDIGLVGSAIADLNTGLGLTGPELEALAKQQLDLARVTGTDLTGNISGLVRTMGDWGIEADDASGAMDTMFSASQATGIGVDQLQRQLVQYGAPMRQFGFGFTEATALLGKFEKEGVNTELVMGSMRQGLGKLARDGEEPIATFERVTDEIANAGSTSEANALALELFGARAGPDMAAAIREGRFEIGDLVAQLGDADGSLADAADRTLTMNDRFKMFKNRVSGTLGPFGEFGALAAGGVAAIGPLLFGLGSMAPVLGKVGGAFLKLAPIILANPLFLIAAAIVAAGAAIWIFRDEIKAGLTAAFDWVKDKGGKLIGWFKDLPGKLLAGLKKLGDVAGGVAKFLIKWHPAGILFRIGKEVLPDVIGWAKKVPGKLLDGLKKLGDVAGGVAKFAIKWHPASVLFRAIKNHGPQLFSWVKGLPGKILTPLRKLGNVAGGVAKFLIRWHPAAVLLREKDKVWPTLRTWFVQLPGNIASAIGNLGDKLTGKGKALLRGFRTGVTAYWRDHLKPWITGLPGKIVTAVGTVTSKLTFKGRQILGGFLGGLVEKVGEVISWFSGLPGRIVGWIGPVGSTLWQVGRDIIYGFWDGIQSLSGWLAGKVGDFFGNLVPGWAKSVLGADSPSKVFMGIGGDTTQGFVIGMDRNSGFVRRHVGDLATDVEDAFAPVLSPTAVRSPAFAPAAAAGARTAPMVEGGIHVQSHNDTQIAQAIDEKLRSIMFRSRYSG